MLKSLLPNSEMILQECINQTFEYLESHPQDFPKKKPLSKHIVAKDIGSWFDKPVGLKPRTTVPDELVSDLLELYSRIAVTKRIWNSSRVFAS